MQAGYELMQEPGGKMMYPVITTFLFRSGARWLVLGLLAHANVVVLELAHVADRITGRTPLVPRRRFL
jgi:hypothetical protein